VGKQSSESRQRDEEEEEVEEDKEGYKVGTDEVSSFEVELDVDVAFELVGWFESTGLPMCRWMRGGVDPWERRWERNDCSSDVKTDPIECRR